MQRILQRIKLPRQKSKDVEIQMELVVQQGTDSKRLEFVQLLFDIQPDALSQFPGFESYCDYLEYEAFPSLMGPTFDSIWGLVSWTKPTNIADCWDWSLAVLQAMKSQEPDFSIYDIALRIAQQDYDSSEPSKWNQNKSYLSIAVFGVLCWSTLMVRPKLLFTADVKSKPDLLCLPPHGVKPAASFDPTRYGMKDTCMRPIPVVFRGFKQQYWDDLLDERLQGDGVNGMDNLYEANLNMYSLRYFGHVTIQWVDTINEHLRFNPANRRLSVFRFPTFCALFGIHGENTDPTIQGIGEKLDILSPEETNQSYVSLEQEVMQTYRVLFGQDRQSRKLARSEISRLQSSHPEQNIDVMLSDLCERKYQHGSLWWKTYDKTLRAYPSEIWPITCRTIEGHLLQSEVYSAKDDFPRLGRRLMKLQQFSSRQRPSKLTDVWRDRRNPLQWYTFWAVVLVGGLANLLAGLQLIIAIIDVRASF